MSDLFFNAREAAQRQLDLDAAEPSPSFWDQAGYAGQRLWEGGVLRSGAMLAEGVMGPALEATGRTLQDRSIPFAGEDFNTGWKGFWDAVGDRAEAGMEEARAFRRTLDQADPGRVSDASELLYQLSNMLTLGATGAVTGGTLAGWAGAGAIGTAAARGAGSATLLGSSFGVSAYNDFVDEGVSPNVARNAALIEGVSMGFMGALPLRCR